MQARHSRLLDRGERRDQILKLFGGKQMFEQISYLLQWQFTFFHINGSFSQVTLIELKKQLAEESHEKESLNGALAEAGHSR
jgi:chemotaxis receptor (MCP) glutamine deamidase CheD